MCKTELEKKIDELMNKWSKYCHNQPRWSNAVFVKDGPFPYYEDQKTKILFIARELYGRQNDKGGLTINYWDERAGMDNLGVFQSRLLYIAYGIAHGQCTQRDWEKMQEAKELNREPSCFFR